MKTISLWIIGFSPLSIKNARWNQYRNQYHIIQVYTIKQGHKQLHNSKFEIQKELFHWSCVVIILQTWKLDQIWYQKNSGRICGVNILRTMQQRFHIWKTTITKQQIRPPQPLTTSLTCINSFGRICDVNIPRTTNETTIITNATMF